MSKHVLVGVIMSGIILSGCIPGLTGKTETVSTESINESLTGIIQTSRGDGTYTLKTTGGGIVELHDGNVVLEGYVGKTVTVTGQYSGTTLYVDQVVVQ